MKGDVSHAELKFHFKRFFIYWGLLCYSDLQYNVSLDISL